MNQNARTKKIPGITLEEEKKTLTDILKIADENLQRTKADVEGLANELNELKEVYDVEDKEGLAQWFNTDARFQQVRQDLLRSRRSRSKPYFGRIDFADTDHAGKKECYYIGRSVIAKDAAEPLVIDWRAPIASVYYEKSLGKCAYSVKGEGAFEIDLSRKRTYEIENDELKDFYDSDVVANDDLLTKYLARNKRAVLSEIIATIQQEQNEIIRRKPQHNVIVQGSAGSGKTTVAMHRISYILYNYPEQFKPESFYIVGSNKILLNYITGILPDLDVYGISQMTMEQLFIRLLYEDWDKDKYSVKKLNKGDKIAAIKGSFSWFHDLEQFCERYEWEVIPRKDIYVEKTNSLLMKKKEIEDLLNKFNYLSLPDKKDKLAEHLISKLENEIYGKYCSYPKEEQKRLLQYYQTYFGKREWKGSIFELYHNFMLEQNAKGSQIELSDTEFDLYDLAALAYLYKRIKETEVIQEASHVVIDEAQDFGMSVYGALKYCLSKCTYTIMGDVSQNIYFDYGLSDWEELRSLMLPEEFDYFGLLKKSYRNTVEISHFATNILHHGHFPIYPVEPILRHGKEVRITSCKEENLLIEETVRTVTEWKKDGFETIAVICKDKEESARVTRKLGEKIDVREFDANTEEFGSGVIVLSIEYAKGLEFDTVLLFNASQENYPAEDGYVKLLYVAATRALHELVVLHSGELTKLIAEIVPEEKKKKSVVIVQNKQPRKLPEEDARTKKEIELEKAREGHKEMEQREAFGPRRIVVKKPNPVSSQERPSTISSEGKTKVKTNIGRKVDYYATALGRTSPVIKNPNLPREIAVSSSAIAPRKRVISEFGDMPDNAELRPLGHANQSFAVKWLGKDKSFVDITTASGILRITPISADTIRISYGKGSIERLVNVPIEIKVTSGLKWNCRESREVIEISTEKVTVKVDKKSGILSFFNAKGKQLLTEKAPFPRQIGTTAKNQTWNYFDWTKKEILQARGNQDGEWIAIAGNARFISLGVNAERPACLMSNCGYQILIPTGVKAMCCTIPMYGNYLYTEGDRQIDYFFRSAR